MTTLQPVRPSLPPARLVVGALAVLCLAVALVGYLAGYRIIVDLGNGGTSPAPAGPTLPPTPLPAASPTASAGGMAPSTPVAPTEPPAPAAPATPPQLDTTEPPFRVVLDGTATELRWDEASVMARPGGEGALVADLRAVRSFVAERAAEYDRPAQRAAFHWNANKGVAEVAVESHAGRAVRQTQAVSLLAAALETGHGTDVVLPVSTVAPEWTSNQLPTFGTDVVAAAEISYGDDDPPTVQNVEQGALALDGAVALPGAVFSHDAWVYDGRAYAPSFAIVGDRTLLAPGGGLCIVSTTLFRAAFWGGLPIVERHNHPYWIPMYTMT
ncbi:MAG TPA: VanW family protein, partial [Chloroflexia bacterium]|nr:VanW family protein [Chloroflexia bacterium]